MRERETTMAEDTNEHLGSSDCSSGQYECRERRLAEEQRFLEAAYQDAVEERDKYKSDAGRLREVVGQLRVLLLGVLENDMLSGGLGVLDDEMRQRIRDGLSWKIE